MSAVRAPDRPNHRQEENGSGWARPSDEDRARKSREAIEEGGVANGLPQQATYLGTFANSDHPLDRSNGHPVEDSMTRAPAGSGSYP